LADVRLVLLRSEGEVKLEQIQQHIPQSVQTGANWGSVGAALASFFGAIQGPLAVLASLLSICWLSLQIYSWFKHRKGK
jgi:hypothetical protein